MNKPQIFEHPLFGQLPIMVADGLEWFGATEAAVTLSFSNPYDAIKNHVEEDDLAVHEVIDSLGRKQNKKFTNESGLYSLILGAAKQGNNPEIKEKAKSFKRWVTGEVLPSIRKRGMFVTDQLLDNPDFAIEVFQRLKEERAARLHLENKIEADKHLVLYAESMQVSKDSILVNDMSKILKQNGVDIGEKRLFRFLREEGYLIKGGSEYNMPTQRSMNLGIMEIKVGQRASASEGVKMTRTTKITGKGQIYFINKFLKKQSA